MTKILDAIALASMEKGAQLQRLAALWCRATNDREPYNSVEMRKWVKREFGPLLDVHKIDKTAMYLFDETRRQLRCRARRAVRNAVIDPCTTPTGSGIRLGRLLISRLGPARCWVDIRRMLPNLIDGDCHYIDGALYSGLLAGLIPVKMRLRSISNPNLLVYRHRWGEVHTRFVATHITTVADAFIWLIPPAAADFLQLPGTRVEHNGDAQTVLLHTQFGSKTLPWRKLVLP